MNDSIITIEGLHKSFKIYKKDEGLLSSLRGYWGRKGKSILAVDGIDLKVQKGEIRGLIGPNGAGKSTTIKIMSGILHPDEGKVEIMGMTPWKDRKRYVKNLGVLFGQKSQLNWDLPAVDTFALHREMYGIGMAKYRERIAYFGELLNISEIMYKPVRLLSLGERMKCELVCALLHEPALIFLDEPTIGLDIISKQTIRNFIKRTNQDMRTTFIVTTHDVSDLEDLCDKVTIINKGTVVFDDTMQSLGSYFRDRKIIDVSFRELVPLDRLEDYKVLSYQALTAKIEVQLGEKDIKQYMSEIFDCYPIKDINISNIRIEDVIKHIYSA
ncbi:ABC transporter ATP-binding protein [Paenibacillus tarimensis]|uniref:ABC transporter ATP-binding protein n=1 Tax=Paenibacillus tarimensis TaxID=416012 RepID=UPI001F2E5A4B|nr:ATP-binding cassette domain-containing protein [Paenibacillus tarimensis]MCF2945155.1 ATP-binding cassette domain-containing protein [Paenibacillus tarimensis]